MRLGVHEPTDEEIGASYDPHNPMSIALSEVSTGLLGLRDQTEDLLGNAERRREDAQERWGEFPLPALVPVQPNSRYAAQFDAPAVRQPGYLRALYGHRRAESVADKLGGTLLLGAMSAYDAFIGNLLRATYKLEPRTIRSIARGVPWQDLMDLTDIPAVRGLVIEREVDHLSHLGRLEQLAYFEGALGIKTLTKFEELGAFVELAERRNLMAHTGGRVSDQYVKQCRAHNVDCPYVPGDVVGADAEYVRHACEVLLVVAAMLTQTIWRSVGGQQQLKAADNDLSHLTYTLLAVGENRLAERFLRFATGLPVHSSEVHRLVFTVNYAQSFKWQGKDTVCGQIMAKDEWNSKAAPFQLAAAVLADDFTSAANLMRDVAHQGQLSRAALEHWPLFQVFRTTPEYAAAYRELFRMDPPGPPTQLHLIDLTEAAQPA